MPKFGLPGKMKKKKKEGKSKKAAVSPLMADDDDEPQPPPSKEKKREAQRKEREERREKRDHRLEDSKADSKSSKSSSKSKKKSKPKLSQEEQDANDAKLGCCHKFSQFLVKMIHLLDGLIGFTFLIYGLVINFNFKTPAMEAVITSLTYGSALLFASIMGVVGFYSSRCNRVGLAISAYMGPFIAFFYIFVIIAMLTSSETYWAYLSDNKDVLHLTDAQILILIQILPFFYIVLASLAAIEICRFFGLRKIRHTLVKFDDANKRIIASHRSKGSGRAADSERSKGSERSSKSKRSSKGSERAGSNRTNLTQPLIDEELGGSSGEDSDW